MSFTVIDIETNGIENPDRLWCIVTRDLESGAVAAWKFPSGVPSEHPEVVRGFLSSSGSVSCWIGHNVIAYDIPTLTRFIPSLGIDKNRVIDTLVVARLLNYGVEGGNSLEAWGERLGTPKTHHSDFSSYSEELVTYCINDTAVTEKLYALFSEYIGSEQWKSSLRLEHDIAWLCNDLHDDGFYFDIERCRSLLLSVEGRLRELDSFLGVVFPPRVVGLREVHPKLTRSGTLSRVDFRWLEDPGELRFFSGGPFTRITFEPFNPGSPKQCVDRLSKFGWQPFDRTKGHIAAERAVNDLERRLAGGRGRPGASTIVELAAARERLEHFRTYGWKINEANLGTLPRDAPKEAQSLVEWLLLDSRRSTLEEWIAAYNEQTHRIHGRFNHIGAWTGRMSHSAPNMANIVGVNSLYGKEFRSLWQADPGTHLVGVDADGIQLRILAHYMNDPDFIEALTRGKKEDGTDAHSLNRRALGEVCRDRDTAKTFIYAFLLGAGVGKVAQILGCSHTEASDAISSFIRHYPGLADLKSHRIPADAARGYFVGMDGRLVACDSEHLMLAGYLQNGEAVIMKTANLIWRANLKKEKIPFVQRNFVHDEWQVQFPSLTYATEGSRIIVSAIEEAGIKLKLNCPLAGNASIGKTWLETH